MLGLCRRLCSGVRDLCEVWSDAAAAVEVETCNSMDIIFGSVSNYLCMYSFFISHFRQLEQFFVFGCQCNGPNIRR